MRRLLLVLLMFVLPLQWAWASAASVCAHEESASRTHFGHHQHDHQDAAPAANAQDDTPSSGSLSDHPDCGVCHAMTSAVAPASDGVPALWFGHVYTVREPWAAPDRFVDTLLRPPLTLVA
jgi:cytochrome c553